MQSTLLPFTSCFPLFGKVVQSALLPFITHTNNKVKISYVFMLTHIIRVVVMLLLDARLLSI